MLAASSSSSTNFASFDVPLWAWGALVAAIVILLVADLLIVHRTPHEISFKEAAIESAVWITIGLCFTFVILGWQGGQAAGEYLSGYLIEKSLSVDNVFVWAVIFSYFAVPQKYQFRVLFWGIFGALVLRAIFIFAGVALIETFDWILYVFGAFLLITAFRVARHKGAEVHPENNFVLKLVRRVVPSTPEYDGQKMFTRRTGKLLATPLFAVLILVETTDVVFAVDSIPAILAVSPRAVHRLRVERLRHPRLAGAVLPAGRHGRPVPLPQHRPRRHPGLRRHQDDHGRGVPHAHVREPGGHRAGADDHDRRLAAGREARCPPGGGRRHRRLASLVERPAGPSG